MGVSRLQPLSAVLSLNIENSSNTIRPVILFGVTHPLAGIDGMKDKNIRITHPQGSYSVLQKGIMDGNICEISGLRWNVKRPSQLRYKLYVKDYNIYGMHTDISDISPKKYLSNFQAVNTQVDMADFEMKLFRSTYIRFHMLPKERIEACFTIKSKHDPRLDFNPLGHQGFNY